MLSFMEQAVFTECSICQPVTAMGPCRSVSFTIAALFAKTAAEEVAVALAIGGSIAKHSISMGLTLHLQAQVRQAIQLTLILTLLLVLVRSKLVVAESALATLLSQSVLDDLAGPGVQPKVTVALSSQMDRHFHFLLRPPPG